MTNEQWLAKEADRKLKQSKLLVRLDELHSQIDKTQHEWWRSAPSVAATETFRELVCFTNEKGEVIRGKY